MSISKEPKYTVKAFLLILASTCLLISFVPSPCLAQENKSAQLAPRNPAFDRYMQNPKAYRIRNLTAGGHALGYIPPPIDMSRIRALPARKLAAAILAAPQIYDLRTSGKLTAVRDQGQCWCCWAFATMSSLESNLLPPETWDFSENNLKNTHGFDVGHCEGGNAFMSIAYLSRWSGPVAETEDRYNAYSNWSPTGLPSRKHIQEVLFIPDRTSPTDSDSIKQAIMTYGAVYTTMYMNDIAPYYNAATSSYYYNGSEYSNHMVAIVGWDDNYSSANFLIAPAGNGAFIIRNSWGTQWGAGGYFYISYYDTNIGKSNAVFVKAQPTTNYVRIYQYDPLGATADKIFSNTAWFANVFTSEANEQLAAVSFYTLASNSTYTIKIYTNTSSPPDSGTPRDSTSGTIEFVGYHTITLPRSVPLTSGQKFSIVVQVTTAPGYDSPISLEFPSPGYSSGAAALEGQSYISDNGTSWVDTAMTYNANVCLKAFTVYTPPVPRQPTPPGNLIIE